MKNNWCSWFNCWISDVEEIVDEEVLDACDMDCSNCEDAEVVK